MRLQAVEEKLSASVTQGCGISLTEAPVRIMPSESVFQLNGRVAVYQSILVSVCGENPMMVNKAHQLDWIRNHLGQNEHAFGCVCRGVFWRKTHPD